MGFIGSPRSHGVYDIAERFRLDRCVGCRACSESCTSYRNGGIDPQITVGRVSAGEEPKDIWKCLVCHRCTFICPQDIDVAGMILSLREADASGGSAPERFMRTAASLRKEGYLSVPKGRMEALRKELGLRDVAVDGNAVKELNRIFDEEGFPDG